MELTFFHFSLLTRHYFPFLQSDRLSLTWYTMSHLIPLPLHQRLDIRRTTIIKTIVVSCSWSSPSFQHRCTSREFLETPSRFWQTLALFKQTYHCYIVPQHILELPSSWNIELTLLGFTSFLTIRKTRCMAQLSMITTLKSIIRWYQDATLAFHPGLELVYLERQWIAHTARREVHSHSQSKARWQVKSGPRAVNHTVKLEEEVLFQVFNGWKVAARFLFYCRRAVSEIRHDDCGTE